MYSSRVPPPLRATSAASGDFDPESPRRNSQTGEIGPTPVNTFAPPPTAIQHSNPLFNVPGVPPPSRLPPPPQRQPARAGGQELPPPPGIGFQRPSGLPQPGFLAGMPSVPSIPSVPRTGSWPIKEAGIGKSFGDIGGQNRPTSNALSPTVLSPTQANTMLMNEEAPSAILQVSQPNIGMVYAPSRAGSGSPSMMATAQQYATAFQQQQQQQQPMQGNENADVGAEWAQEAPEMAQVYNETAGYNEGTGGYEGQQYTEQYNDNQQYNEQQYYDNQQYNQQQYDVNTGEAEMAVYNTGQGAGGDFVDTNTNQTTYAAASARKLPPPAVSFESPIKARFARGSAHPSARQGALTGAFNKAAMAINSGLPPPPPNHPQMPSAEVDTGYNAAGINEDNHGMMQGFPSGGFAGSSVASAPAGDDSGIGEVEQHGEEEAVGPAPSLQPPPPPMMGAPGGMFPTFGTKPALPRQDSTHSQPGSARGGGNAPPQFGMNQSLMSAGSGNFMPGNAKESLEGVSGQHPGMYTHPSSTLMPQQQQSASPRNGSGGGNAASNKNNTSGDKKQGKESSDQPKKQRRRGICSVLFILTLVLTLSAAVSVGTTIVAVTFAANVVHAAISGIGSIASGASLSSAIASMHPAAMGIARHVDMVSQAQWEATEKQWKCEESAPTCRGARWALHSARLFGFLTKDAAMFTTSHAPHVIQHTAVPAIHFTKQQSTLLFDQLKGMKTPQGRDAVVAAIHQSAGEVKKLGHDLFVWGHCVYQNLSQSGVHSLNHLVEPAAGCWVETMGHYYLPANSSGISDTTVDSVDDVNRGEESGEKKGEEEEEMVVDVPLPEEPVVLEEEQKENKPVVADDDSLPAHSPMLLEEEEEEEEQVVDVVEEKIEVPFVAPPTPVEDIVEEVVVDATTTTTAASNTTTPAPTPVSAPSAVEPEPVQEEQIPQKHEVEEEDEAVSVAVEEEKEDVVEEVEKQLVPPPAAPAAVVPDTNAAAAAAAAAAEKTKNVTQVEEEILPQVPEKEEEEVVVVDHTKSTTKTPSNRLPDRYASEEEYMMMGLGEHPSPLEEVGEQQADQGPPGASIVKKTTTTSTQKSTTTEPLWPIIIAQFQKLKNTIGGVGVFSKVVGVVRQHQSSILVALGAAGGTAVLLFASGALAARRAAFAARFAGAAQLTTPRRPSAGGDEQGPATVFKSARSKRKTQTAAATTVDGDDGAVVQRGRQSAPARLAAPAFEAAEEEEEPRGRKRSRGGSSGGRSRNRPAAGTSRGRKSTVDGAARGTGRKASVSRKRSTKATS
jgi:hypothetical protein